MPVGLSGSYLFEPRHTKDVKNSMNFHHVLRITLIEIVEGMPLSINRRIVISYTFRTFRQTSCKCTNGQNINVVLPNSDIIIYD